MSSTIRTHSATALRSAFIACANASGPTAEALKAEIAGWPAETFARILQDWEVWARDDQLPPACTANGAPWRTWLFLGGRGAGKTRAGAEWVRALALGLAPFSDLPASRMALIGETAHDVRSVMIEGESGVLSVHSDEERPDFVASKGTLTWPNGVVAQVISAETPDALRGPQFHAAWCDELAKWRRPAAVWDMLQFGLRLGHAPRALVTTTPRAIPLLRQLMDDPATVVTHARTEANAANLAPGFVDQMRNRYGGSLLGRQELDGELIAVQIGALWREDWITSHRISKPPELCRIVVGVDPPVTAHAASDACGLVVVGRGIDGRAYVLADRTVQGRTPDVWARAAVAAYRDFEADRVVAEVNQGGDLVESVLRQAARDVPLRKVRATRGKWLRAEPVAALYAEGRVAHVGHFGALEAQMLTFGSEAGTATRSPDRLDALVWALTDLVLDAPATPTVRRI
ncbi:MAG: terminase family protein [Pseudomonadota bacterium]